jgi:nucleoside-diphosphate-sugar epimerase
VNVHATRRLIDAAVSGGVDRIVFASTIVVYQDSRAPLTEDSPTVPSSLYADTKLHAEREILSARNQAGAPLGTVMRLAAVYGPGVKGNYRSLVKTLDRGWFVPIGPGLNRRALIYVDDAAAAMVAALRTPEAAGRIYNLSDGVGHRLTDIITAISQALGRRPPRFSLPLPLVRAAVGVASTVSSIFKMRMPITRATLDKYTEDIFVDSSRAFRELQFTPRMNLSSGWQATIDGMRADGTLPRKSS